MTPQPSFPGGIRVAIVEDLRRTREGLRALIEGSEGFVCLGAWGSMEDALASAWTPPLHVMLVDLGLPGMSGIEGIALMRKRSPETALVVLTVYEDNDRVFRALCAGATGYLLKNTAPAKLLEDCKAPSTAARPCRRRSPAR